MDAAYALGNRTYRGVGGSLCKLLYDAHSGVREAATWAIGKLRYTGAQTRLISLARAYSKSDTIVLLGETVQALGRLGTEESKKAAALYANYHAESVRSAVTEALKNYPSHKAAARPRSQPA